MEAYMITIAHTRTLFLALAIAGLSTAATAPARAEDQDTVSRKVSAADLDLRTSAGQATLHHRIAVAALKVCEQVGGSDPLTYYTASDCIKQARESAQPQLSALIAAAKSPNMVAEAGPAR